MKKIYLLAAVLAANYSLAQSTVTFDDLTLVPETHYDGSDNSGGFTSGGVYFENSYDTQYNYWSGGFIYSNTTDVTTSGYTNDFSAYTGGGAYGSANYAVNYGGNIDFGSEKAVSWINITNTTYAALSMLNGDSFGKQFGSTTNANGDVDGTNGEDWFRLLIVGKDAQSAVTDTVIFYLADYRFADSLQDYIVDQWELVDLSPLGNVQFIEFTLESTDMGQWGMNTPAYFALDNLVYGNLGTETTEDQNLVVAPNPATSEVSFNGMNGELTIYSAVGAIVYEGTVDSFTSVSVSDWNAGTYFYTLKNDLSVNTGKVVKK